MHTLEKLREEKIKLELLRDYYAYPKGLEVYVVGEMDGERRGENEVILKPSRSHNTFTMREDLFWEYVALPDEVD